MKGHGGWANCKRMSAHDAGVHASEGWLGGYWHSLGVAVRVELGQ